MYEHVEVVDKVGREKNDTHAAIDKKESGPEIIEIQSKKATG